LEWQKNWGQKKERSVAICLIFALDFLPLPAFITILQANLKTGEERARVVEKISPHQQALNRYSSVAWF
jgi:hypothetical protein